MRICERKGTAPLACHRTAPAQSSQTFTSHTTEAKMRGRQQDLPVISTCVCNTQHPTTKTGVLPRVSLSWSLEPRAARVRAVAEISGWPTSPSWHPSLFNWCVNRWAETHWMHAHWTRACCTAFLPSGGIVFLFFFFNQSPKRTRISCVLENGGEAGASGSEVAGSRGGRWR